MKQIIRISIDVTKLKKDAFYKGDKGTYANLTYFYNDDPDQYGKNGGLKQDLGKDRRDEETPFLGNGVIVPGTQKGDPAQASPARQQPPPNPTADFLDEDTGTDCPF